MSYFTMYCSFVNNSRIRTKLSNFLPMHITLFEMLVDLHRRNLPNIRNKLAIQELPASDNKSFVIFISEKFSIRTQHTKIQNIPSCIFNIPHMICSTD